MADTSRIDEYFDFDNPENIRKLRAQFEQVTQNAVKTARETGGVDEETLLEGRDRVFFETILEAIEIKEKELSVNFTAHEKNAVIDRIVRIINSKK